MISALWNLLRLFLRPSTRLYWWNTCALEKNIYTGLVEYRALRVPVRLRCLVVWPFLPCPWWLLSAYHFSGWERCVQSSSSACRFLSLSAGLCALKAEAVCALGGMCTGGRGLFWVQSPLSARQRSSASPVILIFSKPTLSDKYNLYSFFFWTIRVFYSKYVSCRQHITALKKKIQPDIFCLLMEVFSPFPFKVIFYMVGFKSTIQIFCLLFVWWFFFKFFWLC